MPYCVMVLRLVRINWIWRELDVINLHISWFQVLNPPLHGSDRLHVAQSVSPPPRLTRDAAGARAAAPWSKSATTADGSAPSTARAMRECHSPARTYGLAPAWPSVPSLAQRRRIARQTGQ